MRGESTSGDTHVIRERPTGSIVAVLDGIGHGVEAAHAARVGAMVVDRYATTAAIALVRRCHDALIGTRGVVMSVAILDVLDDTLTWLGVGNVVGVLCRADPHATPRQEQMLTRGGVVGLHLPMMQASVAAIAPGDTFAIATDGIRPEFVESLGLREPPAQLAERILREHARDTDDALVVVARYHGRRAQPAAARDGGAS